VKGLANVRELLAENIAVLEKPRNTMATLTTIVHLQTFWCERSDAAVTVVWVSCRIQAYYAVELIRSKESYTVAVGMRRYGSKRPQYVSAKVYRTAWRISHCQKNTPQLQTPKIWTVDNKRERAGAKERRKHNAN